MFNLMCYVRENDLTNDGNKIVNAFKRNHEKARHGLVYS